MAAGLRLRPALLLIAVALAGTMAASGGKSCYFPDGSLAPDLPCFPDQEESMCCYSNHTCLDNGLCRRPDIEMTGQLKYLRGSCTDKQCERLPAKSGV